MEPTPTAPGLLGRPVRPKRRHPARRARAVAGALSATAMVGLSAVLAVAASHPSTNTTAPAAADPTDGAAAFGSSAPDWGSAFVDGAARAARPSLSPHTSSHGS